MYSYCRCCSFFGPSMAPNCISTNPACPMASSATVYEDYDCTLNQTNIGANNNKFYRIQVLQSGSNFYCWTHVSRINQTEAHLESDHHELVHLPLSIIAFACFPRLSLTSVVSGVVLVSMVRARINHAAVVPIRRLMHSLRSSRIRQVTTGPTAQIS